MFKKSVIGIALFFFLVYPSISSAAPCLGDNIPAGCYPPFNAAAGATPAGTPVPGTTGTPNSTGLNNGTSNASTTTSSGTVSFVNPIGATTAAGVVTTVLGNLRGLLVSVALLFIVIGAVRYILSAGDDGGMKSAKNTITAALIGLSIALAAPSFLSEIIRILGGNSGLASDSNISSALTIKQLVTNVLNFLLGIVGILSMIGLVLGGSFYLTAYGDEGRLKTGKNMITASIIGIVVALAALSIVSQLARFFQ